MRLPRRSLLTLALLAGCAPAAPRVPAESVTLPPTAIPPGAGDPTRGAILAAAHAFANPGTLAGNPAGVARALAQLEHITAELGAGGRWAGVPGQAVPALQRGRAEARAAFGFPADAPAQVAVDALYNTAAALEAGNRAAAAAALAPLAGPAGGEAALARLNALPVLPNAAYGTAMAAQALRDKEFEPLDP